MICMWVNSVIFINSHFYLGELLFEEISPTHLHYAVGRIAVLAERWAYSLTDKWVKHIWLSADDVLIVKASVSVSH